MSFDLTPKGQDATINRVSQHTVTSYRGKLNICSTQASKRHAHTRTPFETQLNTITPPHLIKILSQPPRQELRPQPSPRCFGLRHPRKDAAPSLLCSHPASAETRRMRHDAARALPRQIQKPSRYINQQTPQKIYMPSSPYTCQARRPPSVLYGRLELACPTENNTATRANIFGLALQEGQVV